MILSIAFPIFDSQHIYSQDFPNFKTDKYMKTDFPVRFLRIILNHLTISLLLFVSISLNSQSDISGIIWEDLNADGIQNVNEPFIDGVPVFLLTCSGQFIQSTLTSNSGNYIFASVPDNNYKIFINKSGLSQHVFTLYDNDNDIDSNGYSSCFLTSTNEYEINAGLTILPYIGDKVWEDLDGNGLQDPDEPGIQNVLVSLFRANDDFLLYQTETNVYGDYKFLNIFPGDYYLKFTADTVFKPTLFVTGSNSYNSDITGTNGPFTTDIFNIETGNNYDQLDAGFFRCINICGLMYLDANFNNVLDPDENGINGLKIKLWTINASKNTVLFSEYVTSSKPGYPSIDGYYEFCVPPGKYFIETDMPPTSYLTAGEPNVGDVPDIYNYIDHENGLNTTPTFDLQSGDHLCNINNGFYCYGSIQLRIWLDYNFNGIYDEDEEVLPDIPVTLYNMQYQAVSLRYSDFNGICIFDQLKNGDYFVRLDIDPTMSFTIANVGNDNIDNDIDNSFGSGTSHVISVTECSRIDNIGAGLALLPLPLLWESVSVSKESSYNKLEWSVKSQTNVSHYIVLRNSGENTIWEELATIPAINRIVSSYSFDDYSTGNFLNVYYKIISVDIDGRKSVSKIVTLKGKSEQFSLNISPVPADEYIYIDLHGNDFDFTNKLWIDIYNTLGQKVKTIQSINQKSFQLPTSDLLKGLYKLVFVQNDQIISTKAFIISR